MLRRRQDPLKVRLADLRRIVPLQTLSDRRLRKLVPFCRKRILPKNTVVFLLDEPAGHLYFLLDGDVAVILNVAGDRHHTVYTVQPGHSFGWSSMVAPFLYSATAQCDEPSVVIEVDSLSLRKYFEKDHKMGWILMSIMARVISHRLHDTRKHLIDLIREDNRSAARVPVLASTD